MMRLVTLILIGWLGLFCVRAASAQNIDTCEEPGTASAFLEINNVRAALYNNGNLFYDVGGTYEVPKGSGHHSLFASAIWIGGYAEDSLLVSAASYSQFAYRPGPLTAEGAPPEDCTPFDHLWQVNRDDINQFEAGHAATDDLLNWPFERGAPVKDGDGNYDNYDLAAGDRPAIRGDQGIWWVMNDVAGRRTEDQTKPIGLEVQVLAYSFDDPGMLNNTTFYDYTIIYKGDVPLTDTYVGLWADIELGGAGNDLVGSDTTLSMVYGYNANNQDAGYGDSPPALGYVLLDSPTGDDGTSLGMTTALVGYKNILIGDNEAFLNDPRSPDSFYNFMRAHSETGRPVTFGGSGYGFSEEPTPYMFPAEPGNFWSEENTDGNGTAHLGGDRRMMLASGPFTFNPGETQHLRFAIVWAQAPEGSTNPRLDAVAQLKEDVRTLFDIDTDVETTAEIPATFQLRGNYPNPFNPTTRIAFDLPEAARVSLSVYDVLGREVMVLPARQMASGARQTLEVNAESLPSGVYLYRVEVEEASGMRQATGRMVVVK